MKTIGMILVGWIPGYILFQIADAHGNGLLFGAICLLYLLLRPEPEPGDWWS